MIVGLYTCAIFALGLAMAVTLGAVGRALGRRGIE